MQGVVPCCFRDRFPQKADGLHNSSATTLKWQHLDETEGFGRMGHLEPHFSIFQMLFTKREIKPS
jgi:hypothetical protein